MLSNGDSLLQRSCGGVTSKICPLGGEGAQLAHAAYTSAYETITRDDNGHCPVRVVVGQHRLWSLLVGP